MLRSSIRRPLCRGLRVSSIAISILFLALFVQDAIYPLLAGIPNHSAKILIVDVANVLPPLSTTEVRVLKNMNVNDFRVLGTSSAKVIILVGHGMVVKKAPPFLKQGSFALETTERASVLQAFIHPLLVLSGSIVQGRPFNVSEMRVAVTQNILAFSKPFRGKIVVLITCGLGDVESFAKALIDHGAEIVAFTTKPITAREAMSLVMKLVRAGTRDTHSMVEILQRSHILHVIQREGERLS